MKQALLEQLLAARSERCGVAMVTDLASGAQRLVPRREAAADPLAAILDQGFRFDQSGVHKTEAGEFFVNIYNPALRLIIIGAVHIAQALIPAKRSSPERVFQPILRTNRAPDWRRQAASVIWVIANQGSSRPVAIAPIPGGAALVVGGTIP